MEKGTETIREIESIEEIEYNLLLEGIYQRYGYDFRNYASGSLKRRITAILNEINIKKFSELIPEILYDRKFFDYFLQKLSVTVTEMFRDPELYITMRKVVIPMLKTYPFVKIWIAGCATGEEIYSIIILLHEENFYERSHIYATDFNKESLSIALSGVYPKDNFLRFSENYDKIEGKKSLSNYFRFTGNSMEILEPYKKNITFSYHNLVTDGSFGSMNLIICRNVLIYFNQTLQNRVVSLFSDSLCHGGFLCLGRKENIKSGNIKKELRLINNNEKIYRKHSILM